MVSLKYMKPDSIVFISPDYHCSFIYRDQFRLMGWKADIYVNCGHPEKLLYSEDGVLRGPKRKGNNFFSKVWHRLKTTVYYLTILYRYRIHFFYDSIDQFRMFVDKWPLKGKEPMSFRLYLCLAKMFGRKIVMLPSGCRGNDLRANVSKLDKGNVCGNCGYANGACNDEKNMAQFDVIRRYADLVVRMGDYWEPSEQLEIQNTKWKVIDLELWHPQLKVPDQHLLPPTNNHRILHSFFDKDRSHDGKNIKGSPFILDAIERLKKEGYPVEYMYLNDISSCNMRFYQAQADIVVEQLISGWWGSTGVETLALGKPVVCYLRPSWKKFFFDTYPEYSKLPIVEANTKNIYEVLKELVENKEYREQKGRESREFSEKYFDVKKNAQDLAYILEQL